jgi:hypothetical protein
MRSRPIRSFSNGENIRVVTNGCIRVGRTRPIPSGSRTNRPPTRTFTVARLGRAQDRLAQPELTAELEGSRAVADERVGSRLDEEAVDPVGPDLAAESIRGLDEGRVDAGPPERVRRAEAGDPAADDEDRMKACLRRWAGGGQRNDGQSGSVSRTSPVQA